MLQKSRRTKDKLCWSVFGSMDVNPHTVSAGRRTRWQEPAAAPPKGECGQPGGGWGVAEGALHGCGQGQEAAAPAGHRDWERVSSYWTGCTEILHTSTLHVHISASGNVFFPGFTLLAWKTCTTAGRRTAPLSGNCTTRYQIWSWNKGLNGLLC